MQILVLNAGSSSHKSCLYQLTEDPALSQAPKPLWEAHIDWTHTQDAVELKVKTTDGVKVEEKLAPSSHGEAIAHMLETLCHGDTKVLTSLDQIDGVGHRVVHGGQEYQQSVLITPEVKAAIARLAVFAPVHNPANLEGIEAIEKVLPHTPQVAVFDTAFHSHLPAAAYVYPGSYAWLDQGIRRYGFHGISHQYCAQRAAQILGRDLQELRLINCHLGNGCSLAAIHQGQSVDTTMGFTPLEGLMMGSRSGSIDPGILLHLWRQGDHTVDQIDRLLNRESGLWGISGVSADLRPILQAIDQGNDRAQLALEVYIHRLRSGIGAMLASLGGLDCLIFTAGVGENAPKIRAAACEAFSFLGLKLDLEKNDQSPSDQDIATTDSKVRVLVIHTQEDWAIAGDCWRLIQSKPSP